eukprot:jgi/Psemu1/282692/fgenesh1_pg.12_\
MAVSRSSLLVVLVAVIIRGSIFISVLFISISTTTIAVVENATAASTAFVFAGADALSPDALALYTRARRVRALEGHDRARELYREILATNPDDATAATAIAADTSNANTERHDRLGKGGTLAQRKAVVASLESFGFCGDAIAGFVFSNPNTNTNNNNNDDDPAAARRLRLAKASSAPLYLQALRAGTKAPPLPTSPLGACIQLFLMATLYFATDLHPNVLSLTTVGGNSGDNGPTADIDNGAVMYIGPDSLALVDHWVSLQHVKEHDCILDIGCGSGIQALSLVARLSSETTTAAAKPEVKCVDINQRALRVTKLNFEWNDFEAPTLIHGNINTPSARIYAESEGPSPSLQTSNDKPWTKLLGKSSVNYLLSNPPFLPVPVQDPTISSRYGLFSSGGSTGEEFFESLIRLARDVLDENDPSATLAVVSEFMNPGRDFGRRLSSWWGSNDDGDGVASSARALLLTNENALDAAEYAQRRADSAGEALQWEEHLDNNSIRFVSPGLMFLRRNHSPRRSTIRPEEDAAPGAEHIATAVDLHHVVVPKTREGSIWTPTNSVGREFTRVHIEQFASE